MGIQYTYIEDVTDPEHHTFVPLWREHDGQTWQIFRILSKELSLETRDAAQAFIDGKPIENRWPITEPPQNDRRPYYLKYIEWNPTGEHKMVGYSCVRRLENGQESDWHNVGLMLRPKAERRVRELNNAFERRAQAEEREKKA